LEAMPNHRKKLSAERSKILFAEVHRGGVCRRSPPRKFCPGKGILLQKSRNQQNKREEKKISGWRW